MKYAQIIVLLFIFLQTDIVVCTSQNNTFSDQSTIVNHAWEETPEFRLIMRSTADWGRIMFDDTNGTNTNGIRFKEIISYGWVIKHDENDIIDVGVDLTWFDILYGGDPVNKTGDIVAFFKGENDFEYTEVFSDIIFEVDTSLSQIYIYLMISGKGTTTFELYNKKTNTIIWKETYSGDGHTQHIKRYIPSQLFFQVPRVASTTVISMALITILIVIGLNLPQLRNRKPTKQK